MDQLLLNRLYRYAVSLTGERDEAYDLLQQTIERYLRRQPGTIESPSSYLMRSIRNAFFDQVRRRNLHLVVSDEMQQQSVETDTAPLVEDLLIQQQDVAQLMQLLDSHERELLYLWAVEEYTVQEIADMQQVPRGTLLSRLHRLKKRIRQQLSQLNLEKRSGGS